MLIECSIFFIYIGNSNFLFLTHIYIYKRLKKMNKIISYGLRKYQDL